MGTERGKLQKLLVESDARIAQAYRAVERLVDIALGMTPREYPECPPSYQESEDDCPGDDQEMCATCWREWAMEDRDD